MPTASTICFCEGVSIMPNSLRSVMFERKSKNYVLAGVHSHTFCNNAVMDSDSINGGPNFLAAWREWAGMTQAELAEKVGTTQGQIAHLEAERRALSAKWLRQLADAMDITSGWLLENDPRDIQPDILDLWKKASARQRKQAAAMIEAFLKTGTNDT